MKAFIIRGNDLNKQQTKAVDLAFNLLKRDGSPPVFVARATDFATTRRLSYQFARMVQDIPFDLDTVFDASSINQPTIVPELMKYLKRNKDGNIQLSSLYKILERCSDTALIVVEGSGQEVDDVTSMVYAWFVSDNRRVVFHNTTGE